jgi:ribonuclease P protein subunit RPR2
MTAYIPLQAECGPGGFVLETAVCELDTQGIVRRWGAAAERVFGFSDGEAIGQTLPMVPYDLHDETLARLRAAAEGETLPEHSTVWCRNDQQPLEVAVSMVGLSANGHGPAVALVARDISERRLEQLQLEAYAKDVRESFGRELRRARELERSYFHTVRALAAAVEAKDGYTGAHIQRVHAIGLLLAREVAPDQAADPQLAYGFLLHDIGKLSVPDAVLKKPGPLTDTEWTLMRRHPEAGARILDAIPFLDRAVDVVLHHHERWDGRGYLAGLAGEEIPLIARILAVGDAFSAMTTTRPYRKALDVREALVRIADAAGSQLDERLVTEFIAGIETDADAPLPGVGPANGLAPASRRRVA